MAKAKIRECLYKFRKVDQVMLDAILKDIARGAPKKYAAEANGITETMFHALIAQGKIDIENHLDTMEARLVTSLRAIELEEIVKCRSNIVDSMEGHKGAQWTLERAYWRTFSNNAPAKELADDIERMANNMRMKNAKANSEGSKENP